MPCSFSVYFGKLSDLGHFFAGILWFKVRKENDLNIHKALEIRACYSLFREVSYGRRRSLERRATPSAAEGSALHLTHISGAVYLGSAIW